MFPLQDLRINQNNSPQKDKTSFGADVMKIAGGTVFAQLLALLASPVLARIYGPEAFGLLALFTSITTTLGTVACLRYELSIMLPKGEREAANLFGASLTSALLISILVAPLLWLIHGPLIEWLKSPELEAYLWLVPPAVFVSGVFVALNYWNSRTRRYGRLSLARIFSSVASTSVQLGAGLAGLISGGSLIAGSLIGSAVATLALGLQIWRDDSRLIKESLSPGEMALGIKRYRKFPLLDSWSSLLNAISWQLPTFILSAFFSAKVVGYYALGMNVLQLPMLLVGNAIAQVFFQRAAEARHDGSLAQVVESTFLRLSLVGVFPILLLASLGKEIFIVVFGLPWAEAGVYVQILALWTFITFITGPICALFSVMERQGTFLGFNLLLLLARAAALTAGAVSGDPRVALALFALVGVVIWSGICFWLLKVAGISIGGILMSLGRYVLYSLPVLILGALAAEGLSPLDPVQTVALGASAAVPYYILSMRREGGLCLPARLLRMVGASK